MKNKKELLPSIYCKKGCNPKDLKYIKFISVKHGIRTTYKLVYECQKCKKII